jgi:hypothetical protein
VEQVFTFDAAAEDRVADVTLISGSVQGPASGAGPIRPNLTRVTVAGTVHEFVDLFASTSGDEWDHVAIEVAIPAGATELRIHALSAEDGSGRRPASLNWIAALLSLEVPAPELPPLPGKICGLVFCDRDNDGRRDRCEPGIWGIDVTLTCAGPDGVIGTGDDVVRTEKTGKCGLYCFTDVPPGLCVVSIDEADLPSGKGPGKCPLEIEIELLPGECRGGVDFCLRAMPCKAKIGDFVWLDTNKNGRQDCREPGIPRVTVRLLDAKGEVVATTRTSSCGFYSFRELCAGSYTVEVDESTLPRCLVPTKCGAACGDSRDSECGPVVVPVLKGLECIKSVDFGFRRK